MTDKQIMILAALMLDRGPRFDSELINSGMINGIDDPQLAVLERAGYIKSWRSYMAGTAYTITPLGRSAIDDERARRVEVAGKPMRVSWFARLWRRLRGY